MINPIKWLQGKFSERMKHDIGIDLGTANTLVYVPGKGVIVNEPSVVAINEKTGQVVAVGQQAKDMLGRTPTHIKAIRPLVEGVISDYEVTQEMLSYLLRRAKEVTGSPVAPRVVVGVPSGITNVEIRAVRDAARGAGARQVHIVEEPMAAAIGIGLPVSDPIGSMVIDIGGGTTDIAVLSLNGIVVAKNLRVAGDHFNQNVIDYIRDEYKMLVGERTAEKAKIELGSVLLEKEPLRFTVRGRDLATGLPKEVELTDNDIKRAISNSVDRLVEATREVLEATPPEVMDDIIRKGIHLTGGGANITGLDQLLTDILEVKVHTSDEPLTAVARGTGRILENLEDYEEALIANEDEISIL